MGTSLFIDLITKLEGEISKVAPADCTSLVGELERIKIIALAHMIKTSAVLSSAKPEKADDRLLTIPQVAERLAIPKGRAYELARQGRLPVLRIGKYVRVDSAALATWLNHQKDLDTRIYQRYSSPGNDGQGTQKTAKTARDVPSQSRGKSRGGSQHNRSMGAG